MSQANETPTTCGACGGPLTQFMLGANRQFCSASCLRAGRVFCKGCGKPLDQSTAKRGKKTFCDERCQSRYSRVKLGESSSVLDERNRSTCKACGNPLIQNRYGTKQFCKPSCCRRYHHSTQVTGQSLTEAWGTYAPLTRLSIREIEKFMGPGAAKRLATAVDREYVLRYQNNPNRIRGIFTTHTCKACGKEFHRRPYFQKNTEYCSSKCHPKERPAGEDGPTAKLTWEQVDEIRSLYATGSLSASKIGARYGASKGAILSIVNYRSWKPERDPRHKVRHERTGQQ